MPQPSDVEEVAVRACTVPTDEPESDGTLEWDATTAVIVHATAAGRTGLGYSYTHRAAAVLAEELLADVVTGHDALSPVGSWQAMVDAVRNVGRSGVAASAIAAVDSALWDLKARLLDLPLVDLLGGVHERVPVYGSGGFTSYTDQRLREQLAGWAEQGLRMVKMKVGRVPSDDLRRVRIAREAVGDDVGLFVDANGAYDRKQALAMAAGFAEQGVTWYEEPVSSDDLDGLRLLRDQGPPGMEITAGEYGYDDFHFRRLLEGGAVDVLQADVTRCGGVTGFLRVATLCEAHTVPLSAHTAPALHTAVCAASRATRHIEWFHDHVRLERLLFDGLPELVDGALVPDRSRPGNGLELKEPEADRYAA